MPDRIPRLSFQPVSLEEQRNREPTPEQRRAAIVRAGRQLDKHLLRELQFIQLLTRSR